MGKRIIKGIVEARDWLRRLFAFVLVAVILVCAGLLVFVSLSKPWAVTVQVASAVAGAALGNMLRLDLERSSVENQARPAVRRLFDQAIRLGGLVERIESHGATIQREVSSGGHLNPERMADWLESIGLNLRDEINSTATAIDDWGDMAQKVYDIEVERYRNRDARMPFKAASKEVEG